MELIVAFISCESVAAKIESNSFTKHKSHVKQENERNFRIQWQLKKEKKQCLQLASKQSVLHGSHKQH